MEYSHENGWILDGEIVLVEKGNSIDVSFLNEKKPSSIQSDCGWTPCKAVSSIEVVENVGTSPRVRLKTSVQCIENGSWIEIDQISAYFTDKSYKRKSPNRKRGAY